MGPSRSSSPPVVFRFRSHDHHMAILSAGPPLNHLDETHTKEGEKEERALRVSFVAEVVFHGFIALVSLNIHSGPLQPRPECGGMLEPGGAGPRPESSIR